MSVRRPLRGAIMCGDSNRWFHHRLISARTSRAQECVAGLIPNHDLGFETAPPLLYKGESKWSRGAGNPLLFFLDAQIVQRPRVVPPVLLDSDKQMQSDVPPEHFFDILSRQCPHLLQHLPATPDHYRLL